METSHVIKHRGSSSPHSIFLTSASCDDDGREEFNQEEEEEKY
jgi:hypothetical protein